MNRITGQKTQSISIRFALHCLWLGRIRSIILCLTERYTKLATLFIGEYLSAPENSFKATFCIISSASSFMLSLILEFTYRLSCSYSFKKLLIAFYYCLILLSCTCAFNRSSYKEGVVSILLHFS